MKSPQIVMQTQGGASPRGASQQIIAQGLM